MPELVIERLNQLYDIYNPNKIGRGRRKKAVIADEPSDTEQIVAVDIVAELPNQNIVRVPPIAKHLSDL
jgi:hypothetical protein